MSTPLRIPYTQQFSPKVTPLHPMLGILRQHKGNRIALKNAIASAFHSKSTDPAGMAANTLITLKVHGIIDDAGGLTAFGEELVNSNPTEALERLVRNLVLNLSGIHVIETLREMAQGGTKIGLPSITAELRIRGFQVSDNSSDLSGVLGWLREAEILRGYQVDEAQYYKIVGTTSEVIEALKHLSDTQIGFLRAMVALGVTDFTPHNVIARHAEGLYPGQFAYNWKDPERQLLQPLVQAGFIQLRKSPKGAEGAQGGKSTEVKPTAKFEGEIAELILRPMYEAAGFKDIRKIRSIPLSKLVADIRQRGDDNLRGQALEMLAIRVCQLLDLEFYGWRETDEALVAGGEVDGFMQSARLIYSRWQIQCKASDKITYETIAKEVGVAEVTLANVIIIVSTGTMTTGAQSFRQRIVGKTPLNIIIIDGKDLNAIVKNPAEITRLLSEQAQHAMRTKPKPDHLTNKPPIDLPDDDDSGEPQDGPQDSNIVDTESTKTGDTPTLFSPYYSTALGSMYLGDSYDVLRYLIDEGIRVNLLFTSPPFALLRKKAYGNEDQERYVEWFMKFVPLFQEVLEPGGSFVMDIGGTWLPGIPARSVYQYELLLRLCKSGFYLAQEFYHYNPAKLPTPAEWVTIRRIRVKDAMNNVWWFTKEPFVDSDNRRVLREYSESMKGLIKNGYEAKLRPSGHQISEKFTTDNGGSIPPNLLQFSNTESNSRYIRECKKNGVAPHPARFPVGLPDFFIRFLTKPGDIVLDMFAGSNVTGEAAEALGRRWIAIELSEEYAKGSRFRFTEGGSETVQPGLSLPEAVTEPRMRRAVETVVQPTRAFEFGA